MFDRIVNFNMGGGGGVERVCGLISRFGQNFLRIRNFNNFSGSADPINLMDSDFDKK